MDDNFYTYLLLACICAIIGLLLAMVLQIQFNAGVILVKILFNVTPPAVAENVTFNVTSGVVMP